MLIFPGKNRIKRIIKVEFDFNQRITIIQANIEDLFEKVITEYCTKAELNSDSVYFLANGTQVNPTNQVKEYMGEPDRQNKRLKALVYMLERDDKDKEKVIITSKDIICPQCKESCRISIENNKIKLYDCINEHITNDIKISEFADTQKINISEIICDNCKFKNKGNSQSYEFYKCLTCKKNLCPICRPNHNANHKIILYDQKYYICQKHNEPLISYCKKCKTNICYACEEHEKHELIAFKDMKANKEELNKTINEAKELIDFIDPIIKEIINILKEFGDNLTKYDEINNMILNNYEVQRRNYQVLQNLTEIVPKNKIFELLQNMNYNIQEKICNILTVYNKMNKEDKKEIKELQLKQEEKRGNNISEKIKNIKNEMTIIYNIENEVKVKLFHENFVKNNGDKCYFINKSKIKLREYFYFNLDQKYPKRRFEIKLCEYDTITDMSYMFCGCNSLISLPDIYNWDSKNVTNMSYMFKDLDSIQYLPDISKLDTSSVSNMSGMFDKCGSLKYLPDISKWDTKNVTDMSFMFNKCYSLKSLPYVSRWDTKNVNNMSFMFSECSTLSSLPDISNWNTTNVKEMRSMFSNCSQLTSLPNISNWDTKKVKSMALMFSGCSSLKSLPDISKWDTTNVTETIWMFSKCSSLNSFPDISKWKIDKNINKEGMFNGVNKNIIPKKFKGCIIY